MDVPRVRRQQQPVRPRRGHRLGPDPHLRRRRGQSAHQADHDRLHRRAAPRKAGRRPALPRDRVAVDSSGNVWAVEGDTGSFGGSYHRVFKYNADGTLATAWRQRRRRFGRNALGEFSYPQDVAASGRHLRRRFEQPAASRSTTAPIGRRSASRPVASTTRSASRRRAAVTCMSSTPSTGPASSGISRAGPGPTSVFPARSRATSLRTSPSTGAGTSTWRSGTAATAAS